MVRIKTCRLTRNPQLGDPLAGLKPHARPGGQSRFSAELAAQSAANAKVQKLAERVAAHPRANWRSAVLAAEVGVSQRSHRRRGRVGG